MIVYRTKTDLVQHLDNLRKKGKSIGLVPTMGALHPGHLSLVERSASEMDATVVTIFVNPTQFNDPADLEKYPRTPENDLDLLQSNRADVVFIPSVKEMYPVPDHTTFDLGGLDQVMEGRQRKGHFNGVAQIVSMFFEVVRPHRAYFGQKDFQQLVIIRHLARWLKMDTDIVGCPIVREKDGLALSSRNVHLSREERKAAPFIYQTLQNAYEMRGDLSPAQVKKWVSSSFEQHPLMKLEYFEIVEDKALNPVMGWDEKVNKVGCIAVVLGGVRLIDNLFFD